MSGWFYYKSRRENIELIEDELVKDFVGEYEPEHYLLNAKEPMAVGPYAVSNYYMESKRGQRQAMLNAEKSYIGCCSRI